jgi:hypothetical protein
MTNVPAIGTEVASICQRVQCRRQFTYVKRKGPARKYCSDSCTRKIAKRAATIRGALARPPVTRDCGQCGKQFSYAAKAGMPPKYCSDGCRAASALDDLRIRVGCDIGERTLVCQHCGKVFTYTKGMGPQRMYCGERCKANAGAALQAKRDAERVRRCYKCDTAENVVTQGKPICKDCRKEDRDRRDYNRRRRLSLYGLTVKQFDEMLAKQRGKGAICSTDDPGARGWHVDHDHDCCPGTGSCGACVRGLLCKRCNLMLGNAKDSTDILAAAMKYLLDRRQYSM